ncbi:MAG: leucine-rich repeat protein [Oscillospiraceae bacterium]|nr:leucine-rich repeat protein [Oscillospiraceae bacterium]
MKRKSLSLIIVVFILFSMFPVISTAAAEEEKYQAVYEHNLKIYNSKANDEYALAYYLVPIEGSAFEFTSDGLLMAPLIQENFDKEIIKLADSITKDISKDYDKAKAIHDWVANNIWYDSDSINDEFYTKAPENWSANALKNKRCVCSGYANLTAALLRAAGIPAKYISGFAPEGTGKTEQDNFFDVNGNNTNHAWNEAFVDGRWIIIDTTWDSKNKYENGKYSQAMQCKDEYFDIPLKDFSKNHRYKDYNDCYVKNGLIIMSSNHTIMYPLFDKSTVKEIAVPEGVKILGSYIFENCRELISVTIPDSVTAIGSSAFAYCTALESVVIPNSVDIIDSGTFLGCRSLTSVVIPDGVTSIGLSAFRDCSALTSIKIPGKVKDIGQGAFSNCASLTSIALPKGITTIEGFTFSDCASLISIVIPDGVTSIGPRTFNNCTSLTSVTIPDSVKTISREVFSDCASLISIVIPDGVKSIENWTFSDCASLESVVIPYSVTNIVDNAFVGCKKLTLYGKSGSYAEKFAKENNMKFIVGNPSDMTVPTPEPTPLPIPTHPDGTPYKIGDPLGDVLYSDITAYINGHAIPTSIIHGRTLVVVEDLAKYGFDVKWDNTAKILKVELKKGKAFDPLKVIKDTTNKPGAFKEKYVYTNIKTYIGGEIVESFAIKGVTLLDFDALGKYGKFTWDGKTREIRLVID